MSQGQSRASGCRQSHVSDSASIAALAHVRAADAQPTRENASVAGHQAAHEGHAKTTARRCGRSLTATGLFRVGEIDVAVELVQARLDKGAASGYEFVFAEQKGRGASAISALAKTRSRVSSFDVYWIAVEPSKQGQGIGQLLLEEAERQIAAAGGTRIYIETSHRADYQATRGFYERCGYHAGRRARRFLRPWRQQGDVRETDRPEGRIVHLSCRYGPSLGLRSHLVSQHADFRPYFCWLAVEPIIRRAHLGARLNEAYLEMSGG